MSEILNQIQKKDDIKKLNEEELKTLCKELRRFLLQIGRASCRERV